MPRTYDQITLGRRVCALETCGLRLIEASYPANLRFAPHAHERANLSLVLRGQLEETVSGQTVHSQALSVVVKPAGTVHDNRFGPQGARTFVIELSSRDALRKNCWSWFHGGAVAAAALNVFRASRASRASRDSRANVADSITELLGALEDQTRNSINRTSAAWIDCVERELLDRHPEHPSVAQLAGEFNVHPVYLARAFRARFGCTISDYVRRLRVRDAAHCIASTFTGLAQVAMTAGFSDQPHMTRQFKRETGITPANFRAITTDPKV